MNISNILIAGHIFSTARADSFVCWTKRQNPNYLNWLNYENRP